MTHGCAVVLFAVLMAYVVIAIIAVILALT